LRHRAEGRLRRAIAAIASRGKRRLLGGFDHDRAGRPPMPARLCGSALRPEKFQGVIAAQDADRFPSATTRRRPARSVGITSPYARFPSSANQVKERRPHMPTCPRVPHRAVLPCSLVSTRANSSVRAIMVSPIARTIVPRSEAVRARQAGNARRGGADSIPCLGRSAARHGSQQLAGRGVVHGHGRGGRDPRAVDERRSRYAEVSMRGAFRRLRRALRSAARLPSMGRQPGRRRRPG